MIKSQITFTIEERDGERFFFVTSSGNKVFETNITKSEADVFDCIETFMEEYDNLFREMYKNKQPAYLKVAPSASVIPPMSSIKWTSNSTN